MPAFIFEPTMDFFIPFLFVLAIVLGVLEFTLKNWSKPVKVVISLAIAFFAVSYPPFVATLWSYLPSITWFFIIMFFLVFIMEVFGIRKNHRVDKEAMIIQGAVLFILLGTGYFIVQNLPITTLPFIGNTENLIFLIGIIFILLLFWSAFKVGPEKQQK
ncbi:MAG: hypothetical protein J7K26_03405 [Candidatus Aenigmarchaeota archaeon]|nr:hypothetical protein [Candidatus Aenigmarchaeota archaeon]